MKIDRQYIEYKFNTYDSSRQYEEGEIVIYNNNFAKIQSGVPVPIPDLSVYASKAEVEANKGLIPVINKTAFNSLVSSNTLNPNSLYYVTSNNAFWGYVFTTSTNTYIKFDGVPALIDALDSTSTTEGLTANQGKILKGLIDDLADDLTTLANNRDFEGTYWFGKTKSSTVVPAPTLLEQNYFDFTANTVHNAVTINETIANLRENYNYRDRVIKLDDVSSLMVGDYITYINHGHYGALIRYNPHITSIDYDNNEVAISNTLERDEGSGVLLDASDGYRLTFSRFGWDSGTVLTTLTAGKSMIYISDQFWDLGKDSGQRGFAYLNADSTWGYAPDRFHSGDGETIGFNNNQEYEVIEGSLGTEHLDSTLQEQLEALNNFLPKSDYYPGAADATRSVTAELTATAEESGFCVGATQASSSGDDITTQEIGFSGTGDNGSLSLAVSNTNQNDSTLTKSSTTMTKNKISLKSQNGNNYTASNISPTGGEIVDMYNEEDGVQKLNKIIVNPSSTKFFLFGNGANSDGGSGVLNADFAVSGFAFSSVGGVRFNGKTYEGAFSLGKNANTEYPGAFSFKTGCLHGSMYGDKNSGGKFISHDTGYTHTFESKRLGSGKPSNIGISLTNYSDDENYGYSITGKDETGDTPKIMQFNLNQNGGNIKFGNESSPTVIDFATLAGNYSIGEVLTGNTWVDGKPIYRNILQASQNGNPSSNGWADSKIPIPPNMHLLINYKIITSDGSLDMNNGSYIDCSGSRGDNIWYFFASGGLIITGGYIILEYTKQA